MSSHSNDPHRYDDIIDLPHFVSKKRPQMPVENRAAQFAPFAALVGYDAAIKETARLTSKRILLDDGDKIMLNGLLQHISEHIKSQPEVTITYFLPDERKSGGAYVDLTGRVKKIDEYERMILMMNGSIIPIDEVIAIESELFKDLGDHLG